MIRCAKVFFLFFIFLNAHSYGKEDVSQITSENFKQELDSTGIKVVYDKKDLRRRHRYTMKIFINKEVYESDAYPENGFIYIPDTLKPNSKIKVVITPDALAIKWTNQIVKSKIYKFNYSESEKVTIKIKYKKGFNLFRTKPNRNAPNFY